MENDCLRSTCAIVSQFSRKPISLSLAAIHEGVTYYITQEQWACLGNLRHEFEAIGVTVLWGDYNFIVSLKNTAYIKSDHKILREYARLLPFKAFIYICEHLDINALLVYFGGDILYEPIYTWDDDDDDICVLRDNCLYEISYDDYSWIRVFHVISEEGIMLDNNDYGCQQLSSHPEDGYLAVEHNNNIYYLTQHQWFFLKERETFRPIGLTIKFDDTFLIIGLNDLTDEDICWKEAYDKYASLLPSFNKSYMIGTFLINNWKYKYNALLMLFGGTPLTGKYWTNVQEASLDMTENYHIKEGFTLSYHDTKCRCRAIHSADDLVWQQKESD